MSYQVSCCHLHTPLYFFSCHPTALLQRDNNHATVLWLQSQMNEKTCAAWSATVVTTRRRLVCLIFHFKVWGRIHSVWRAPLNSYIFAWGLVWLEGQNHVKKEDVPSDLAGWAEMHSNVRCELQSVVSLDPIWFYLQWSYEVWTSPQRLQGEGRWCIEGRHDEAEERRRVG